MVFKRSGLKWSIAIFLASFLLMLKILWSQVLACQLENYDTNVCTNAGEATYVQGFVWSKQGKIIVIYIEIYSCVTLQAGQFFYSRKASEEKK